MSKLTVTNLQENPSISLVLSVCSTPNMTWFRSPKHATSLKPRQVSLLTQQFIFQHHISGKLRIFIQMRPFRCVGNILNEQIGLTARQTSGHRIFHALTQTFWLGLGTTSFQILQLHVRGFLPPFLDERPSSKTCRQYVTSVYNSRCVSTTVVPPRSFSDRSHSVTFLLRTAENYLSHSPTRPPPRAAMPPSLSPATRPTGPPTNPPTRAPATGNTAAFHLLACE